MIGASIKCASSGEWLVSQICEYGWPRQSGCQGGHSRVREGFWFVEGDECGKCV